MLCFVVFCCVLLCFVVIMMNEVDELFELILCPSQWYRYQLNERVLRAVTVGVVQKD